MSRPHLVPDESHPITITPTDGHVRVTAGETVVADAPVTLTLQEAGYPPVVYVPRSAIDPALLERSETTTYCPYKGDATYYSLSLPTGTVADAAWTYEAPYDAVADVRGHLAFYPDRVEVTVSP